MMRAPREALINGVAAAPLSIKAPSTSLRVTTCSVSPGCHPERSRRGLFRQKALAFVTFARIIAALPQLFERAGIDPKLRGETLDVPAFVRLGKAYQELA
ncbi:hypothetical protein [uncultured Eggerthella sp.]|uniref:hypothetical protein n=1 Tax=uncultured Eggerthella sp. TaxID=293422 RepID=UPI00258527CD|nr:hypothetical protein [uncultured Eggerthella sp.]